MVVMLVGCFIGIALMIGSIVFGLTVLGILMSNTSEIFSIPVIPMILLFSIVLVSFALGGYTIYQSMSRFRNY